MTSAAEQWAEQRFPEPYADPKSDMHSRANFLAASKRSAAIAAFNAGLEHAAKIAEARDFGPGDRTPFTAPANHRWGALQAAAAIRKERAE